MGQVMERRAGARAEEITAAIQANPVVILAGFALAATLALTCPSAVNVAALGYAILAICLNFPFIWANVGNGQRGTYELLLMLALSSLAVRSYPRRVRAGLIGFWSLAAAYVFFGGFDAAYIRSATIQPLLGY